MKKTVFSLKGAHAHVRCKACHANFQDVNGKSVLFYKPTPTACAGCHGNTLKSVAAQTAHPQEGFHGN